VNTEVVSQQLLEEFFAYICDNEGTGESSFGLELEFYERNNFDPEIANWLYKWFGSWVNRYESPLAIQLPDGSYDKNGRDMDYARAVAIQLRNYFRAKFGRPPLSDDEIAAFALGAPPLPHAGNKCGWGLDADLGVYRTSRREQEAAARFALEHYPGAVAYIRAIKHLAPAQGYAPSDVYGEGVPVVYISDALRAVLPPLRRYTDLIGFHDVVDILSS
jgi:hypothetical protein